MYMHIQTLHKVRAFFSPHVFGWYPQTQIRHKLSASGPQVPNVSSTVGW